MIISASRRTDIPAFYAEWFARRIEAGYCTVVNPFNSKQVTRVSLAPADVDVIVFWTRNAKPMLPYLSFLDARKFAYYFQYTITSYPKVLEPNVPSSEEAIDTFKKLSAQVGAERLIWRYDPICLTNITDCAWHLQKFKLIAEALQGQTKRVVISIVDNYRKAEQNFRQLAKQGMQVETATIAEIGPLLQNFAEIAADNNMEISSCAEVFDLTPYGIKPGKCIDDDYIRQVFGISVYSQKDKGQRPECGCVQSKDIGVYDTCLHGCAYCYAGTLQMAAKNYKLHDDASPSLLGCYDVAESQDRSEQGKLF